RQDRHERDQDDSEMSYHHVIGATIAHRPAQSSALGSQGNRCSSVAAVGTIGCRREKRGVPVSAEIQVVSGEVTPLRSRTTGTSHPVTSRLVATRMARSGRASISSTRIEPLTNMSLTVSGSTTWKRLDRSSTLAIR